MSETRVLASSRVPNTLKQMKALSIVLEPVKHEALVLDILLILYALS